MEKTTENNNSQAEESNKKIKRSADKQLTSDDTNHSEEETEQGQEETWKPADDQTVSQRRKVKVRRNQGAEPTSEPTTTSAPPVANWPKFDFGSLPTPAFPTSAPSATTPEKKPEDKPKEGESPKPSAPQFKFDIPATNFTFQPVSFSPNFSFTPAPPSTSGAPIFGFNIAPPKAPANKDEEDGEGSEIPEGEADSFYNPNAKQEEAKDAEAAIQGSGEEEEIHAFQAKSKLFVLENTQWKERGIGYIRVNVAKDESFARLIMRTDVSRRVILNFRLWPSILMDKIADKQVRVVGPSADKPKELCSYLIRFGKPELATDFISAVNKHKSTGHSSNSNNNTNTETNKSESEKQPETTAEK